MIGIVGGVGPLAGLDIFRKIIEATAAACDQDHLPVILHSLPGQIPDRTDYLLGKVQENPARSAVLSFNWKRPALPFAPFPAIPHMHRRYSISSKKN